MKRPKNRIRSGSLYPAICILLAAAPAAAQELTGWQRATRRAIDRGLTFLTAAQQPDGGWIGFDRTDPAVTALVAKCFIQDPAHGPDHAVSRKAVEFILTYAKPDGGIYIPDRGLRNYHTSVSLMALSATRDPKHAGAIARAQEFLKNGQWDEKEGYETDHPWYGGAGYGKNKRPDLSNTQMMLEALAQSGLPPDDPVYRKALRFVTRSQMASESNDQPFAKGAADGGFIYTPANNGESKAGREMVGGELRLRSYGSMTYAGFKSLLHAGLARDDPRVKTAFRWIQRHYTLEENPNMPGRQSEEGLYYYYHVFARALDTWGEDVLVDALGRKHPWRAELCHKLIELQRPDGSWVNDKDRWYEGNPHLVTAYAVLAMQIAAR